MGSYPTRLHDRYVNQDWLGWIWVSVASDLRYWGETEIEIALCPNVLSLQLQNLENI